MGDIIIIVALVIVILCLLSIMFPDDGVAVFLSIAFSIALVAGVIGGIAYLVSVAA